MWVGPRLSDGVAWRRQFRSGVVGTLQTGYTYIQALSQGREWGVHACAATSLLTREGSGVATCPVALDPASLIQRAPMSPRV
jgi:hypothetical protein